MNKKQNTYVNEVGEVLTVLEFNQFVRSETKRQYEECSGEDFEQLNIDEREEMFYEQWDHQLTNRGWKVTA